MSVCRSCGATVVWAVTFAGRRMPVDPEPRADGNLALITRDEDETPLVLLDKDPDGREPRYVSHFATCPNAGDWRRR